MGHDTEALPVITVDDYELDVVSQFTYLGSAINANLSPDTGIDKSIGQHQLLNCLARLKTPVCANSKLSVRTKYGSLRCLRYQPRMLRSIRRMLGTLWQDKMSNGAALSCGSLPHVPAAQKIQPGYTGVARIFVGGGATRPMPPGR